MSWIKTAKIGDKVTPIDMDEPWYVDGFGYVEDNAGFPVFGEVYTIRDFAVMEGVVHIALAEFTTPPIATWTGPPCFCWKGFRPVTPRATDISVFISMLTPASSPVEEVA